jgi:hypothetical protein
MAWKALAARLMKTCRIFKLSIRIGGRFGENSSIHRISGGIFSVVFKPASDTPYIGLRLAEIMNEAGIPIIAINLLPEREGHQFLLAWTGPNDWGQFRLLARKFAELMPRGGKYCIVQHYPGWSPFFARTWAVVTELKKIRPDLACLDMQTTGLEAERTREVVAGWLTQYGKELSGIVSCDDSGAQVGRGRAPQGRRCPPYPH